MASYRNTYQNFYTDKQGSYVAIGAIVPVLANKHTTNSTESGYTAPPNNVIQNSHYCQRGFLYCDGEEYDISLYPSLYEKIRNDYNDSTEPDSLTNPTNNNSILFSSSIQPGSIRRTFVDDGDLFCEIKNKVETINNNVFSTRVVPNKAEISFVGGLGDFPAGTDANGDPIFEEDTDVVLEYASDYQDKATDPNVSVHKFMVGASTETADIIWNITSSTLIQGSDPLPVLPESYYGTIPEYDPTGGVQQPTGATQYTNALNWSPQLSWGGMQGLPTDVTIDFWEIYLQDMCTPNEILWHVTGIPAATTSFNGNQILPTGASFVKNTVDRAPLPRPGVGNIATWIRDNGYSGPQPETNTKVTYRFNVICHLTNGQELIENLDFTAGSGPLINVREGVTRDWSDALTSAGAVTGATNGFEEKLTSTRSVGAGGLTFTPPENVQYNFKLEIYDPSGNGNTRSRVWSSTSPSSAKPWVNHGTGWTTIHEVSENSDGSMNQGNIYKIEFENYSNAAGDAGFSAIRIDGDFRFIDGENEPLQDSPHFINNLVVEGSNSGVNPGAIWNIDWTSLPAYTNTAGTVTGHPLVRIRKAYVQSDFPQILGKFKVPDYRDRKIIGMGEGVSGSGTPLVEGRSSIEVGNVGGKWTISKDIIDDAGEFFEISDVVTTGYSDVNTLIQPYLTGEKEFVVGPIQDYTFNRTSEHSHQLLHSVADDATEDNIGGVDSFTTSYRNIKGRVMDFEPDTTDGSALGHSHGLMDTRPASSAMATYGNSVGIGDKVQEYSGGTLEDDFNNPNAPTYSDQNGEPTPAQDAYYPVQNAFDGASGNYCDMTVADQKWSMLTFGVPIGQVIKIVIGYDGEGKFGYNTGNLSDGSNSNGTRKDLTLYDNSTAITLNNLYFVTSGNPLSGTGDGSVRLYDLKLTLSGGSEIEVKQVPSGCSKYRITEPATIGITSMTSDGTNVTVITTDDHGLSIGDWVKVRGSGTVGEAAKYNGEHEVITAGFNNNTIKYTPVDGAPASGTTPGGDVTLRQAAGYYENVTTTPDPAVWSVDSLPTTIGNKPIYSTDPDQYGDALWEVEMGNSDSLFTKSASASDNQDVAIYVFSMRAQGGGGASSNYDGVDGGNSSVTFSLDVNGSSVQYTVTLEGGKGGQKGTSGGTGGAGGTVTITSTDGNPGALLNDDRVNFSTNATGNAGASGGALDNSQPVGGSGGNGLNEPLAGKGGNGSYSTNPASGFMDYPATGVMTTNGSWNARNDSRMPSAATLDYIEVTAVGGAGGDGSKQAGAGLCPTYPAASAPPGTNANRIQKPVPGVVDSGGQSGLGGDRGRGRQVFGISGKQGGTYNVSSSYTFVSNFSWVIGSAGEDGRNENGAGVPGSAGNSVGEANTAGGTGVTNGGNGGYGYWGNGASGGAGGGSTGIKNADNNAWIMGAGGGGGAGGSGGGWNGGSYVDACWTGGSALGPAQGLYENPAISPGSQAGGAGGQTGCTAGGGGGGGGGFGVGGSGDGGVGGEGGAGHSNTGSGLGGRAGRSAISTTYFESRQPSEGGEGDGYVKFRAYYTGDSAAESGGAGGAGAFVQFSISGDPGTIDTAISITKGNNGGGAGQGGSPVAAENGGNSWISASALPLQEGGRRILGTTTPAGRVYEVPGFTNTNEDWSDAGTGSTGVKADIWHSASDDIKMITPATGTFPALANHSTVPAGHPTSNYFRFYGTGNRWLKMGPLDLSSANKLVFSIIRGTGSNGGQPPEEALELKFSTSVESEAYTDIQQIATASDGTNGQWFNSEVNFDANHPARKNGIYLYILQSRPSGAGDNDTASEDTWGLGSFGIVYGEVTERVFVPSISAYLPSNTGTCGPDSGVDVIRKTITANETNIRFTDGTFTLSSATPISVSVEAKPQETIPLITRYHRAKYLIKAF